MVSRSDKIAIGVGVVAAAAIGAGVIAMVVGGPPPPPGQPVLAASPSTIVQGQQVSFNVTGGAFTSYAFNFGDGQSATTNTGSVVHVYNATGSFTATVTTVDSTGVTASATTTVTVTQIQPGQVTTSLSVMNSPSTANPNQTVNVTGTLTRSDLGTGVPNEPVTIEISQNLSSWTPVQGTIMTDANGNYSGGITFIATGIYYIRTIFAGGLVV